MGKGWIMATKPFFYRINASDLLDAVTDYDAPEERGKWVLRFAKALVKADPDADPLAAEMMREADEYREKKVKAAIKGNEARWGNRTAIADESHRDRKSSPVTETEAETEDKEHTLTSERVIVSSHAVEAIYQAYPRKVGKKKALEIIRRIVKAEYQGDPSHLLQITKNYAGSVTSLEMRYIPHPATWYTQGRYQDDPVSWATKEGEKVVDDRKRQALIDYDEQVRRRIQGG